MLYYKNSWANAWLALRLALASFAGALRDVSLTLAPETHVSGCGKVRLCQTQVTRLFFILHETPTVA